MDTRIDTARWDGTNNAVDDGPITPAAEPTAELTVEDAPRANPICGEPIHAHGVTLVTVARIGTGFAHASAGVRRAGREARGSRASRSALTC